jgi:hypothetical protein
VAIKDIFNTMKSEGYILKRLDQYLLTKQDEENDRRWDINSPSMSSRCSRAIYYSRTSVLRDAGSIDARTQRIFDNGTHVHIRLQEYLLDEGILLMDEVPVYLKSLQIQGHTDGILLLQEKIVSKTVNKLGRKKKVRVPVELGVLEIKSINNNGFSALIDAKEEHKYQAQIYMMCLETERLRLRELCPTEADLKKFLADPKTHEYYASMYDHLLDGNKYTKEEKIAHKVEAHLTACKLLWKTVRPITKMIFIYENKDTQEMKEYCVKWDREIEKTVTDKFNTINRAIKIKKVPPREGTSKSCNTCRFCDFQSECYTV